MDVFRVCGVQLNLIIKNNIFLSVGSKINSNVFKWLIDGAEIFVVKMKTGQYLRVKSTNWYLFNFKGSDDPPTSFGIRSRTGRRFRDIPSSPKHSWRVRWTNRKCRRSGRVWSCRRGRRRQRSPATSERRPLCRHRSPGPNHNRKWVTWWGICNLKKKNVQTTLEISPAGTAMTVLNDI